MSQQELERWIWLRLDETIVECVRLGMDKADVLREIADWLEYQEAKPC